MATEIASLLITAESQTGDAERGLDRLNQKHEQTVAGLKSGQGQVSSYTKVLQAFAQANTQAVSAVGSLANVNRQATNATNQNTTAVNQGTRATQQNTQAVKANANSQTQAANAVRQHRAAVDNLRGSLQSVAGDIRNVGVGLTAGITVPLTAASAAATKFAGDLESKVSLIRTIRPDFDTSAVFKSLSVLQTRIPQTSDQLGEAAYNIVSSLDDIGEAATLNLTEKFGKGASAARVEALDFGTAILGVLNAYGMKVSDVDHIQDLFFQTVNKGIITGGELSRELAGVSKAAQNAGVDVDTMFALIVGATKEAGPAAENMTQLSQVLNQFTSKDAQKGLAQLGIATHDAQGQFRPFISILDEVKKKYDTLSQVDKSKLVQGLFPDIRSQKGFATLLRQLDDVKSAKEDPGKEGSTDRAFETVSKTFNFQFEIFKNTFRHALESIGAELLPILTPVLKAMGTFLVNAIKSATEAWKNMPSGVKTAVVALLGFIASLGPVLTIVGTVAAAVLGLAGSIASLVTASAAVGGIAALSEILIPVGVVIAGLIVLVTEWAAIAVAAVVAIRAAWENNFLGIRDLTDRAWSAIKTRLLVFWSEIQIAYQLIWPQLKALTQNGLAIIQAFWAANGQRIITVVRAAWDIISMVIWTAIRVISSTVTGVLAIINGDWQKAWDMAVRIVEAFSEGIGNIIARVAMLVTDLLISLSKQAARFVVTGTLWASMLMSGFIGEIIAAKPRIALEVAGIAIMLMSPALLALYAASGVAAARARNKAFDDEIRANARVQASNLNPTKYNDEGEYVSGAPGYSDQREQPETSPNSPRSTLPAGFGSGKKSGSGDNAAVRKFKVEMQIADVMVQAIERLNQKALADSEYFYGKGIQDLDHYVEAKRKAADDLFEAENERNNQEAAALAASGIRGRQRDLADAQLSEKVKGTWQKHSVAMAEIDRFAAAERLAIQRASQEAQLSLAQESAAGLESVWQRLADKGVSTFAEAQKRISQSQLEMLQMQERMAVTKLGQSGNPGNAPFEQALAELQQIRQRISNLLQQMGADLEDANQREEDRLLQHKARLDSIYNAIADTEAESARDRLRILEHMGASKEIIWKKQAELELQIEDMQSKRRKEDLERQRDYIDKYEKNEERRAELIAAINSQIEEEDRRSNQRRQNIMDDYFEKQREKLRNAADKIVNVFKTALDRYKEDGWKGFFKSLGESFRDQLEQMALDLMKSRVLSLLQTVFKIPQVTPQGSAVGPNTSGSSGLDFGSLISGLFHSVFGGSNQNQGQPLNNHVSATASIDSAGKAMTEAISKGGERAALGVEKQGANVTGSLTSVGQGIISTMLSIGSMLANANARGGFWKGLLIATGMGALNGLVSGLFSDSGGSEGGAGSAAAGAIGGFADGGMITGPGTSTSDSIPLWASNGEGIINSRAVAHYGGRAFVDAVNAMKLPRMPHMATGGLISHRSNSDYVPPRFAPMLVGAGTGKIEKHYHLNVTHRGGTDQRQIQKSMAQTRRAYSEMIQSTARELN